MEPVSVAAVVSQRSAGVLGQTARGRQSGQGELGEGCGESCGGARRLLLLRCLPPAAAASESTSLLLLQLLRQSAIGCTQQLVPRWRHLRWSLSPLPRSCKIAAGGGAESCSVSVALTRLT